MNIKISSAKILRMVEEGANKIRFWNNPKEKQKTEPDDTEENAVAEVKEYVETALTTTFGIVRDGREEYVKGSMRGWIGRLSISPDAVDTTVTGDELRGKCDLLSEELRIALRKIDFTVELKHARRHSYLTVFHKGHEIIIDPTIGQFIEGHNHVFVGTIHQLRDLPLSKIGERHESIWSSAFKSPARPAGHIFD